MIQLGDLYQYVITSERAQGVLKRLYSTSWEVLLSDKQLFMSCFRDMEKEQPQLYQTFILALEITDLRE